MFHLCASLQDFDLFLTMGKIIVVPGNELRNRSSISKQFDFFSTVEEYAS